MCSFNQDLELDPEPYGKKPGSGSVKNVHGSETVVLNMLEFLKSEMGSTMAFEK